MNKTFTNNASSQSSIFFLLAISVVFAIGLVMIFSTTSAEVMDHDLNTSTHLALYKQIGFALFGLLLGGFVWQKGYRKFIEVSPTLLLIFSFFLLLALIPGIGKEVNGSRRWLGLGGVSFQPSEFVKYIIPAFFIYRMMQGRNFFRTLGLVAIPMGLILIEPNNGTVIVIGMSLTVVFLLTRVPFKYWALPLLTLALVGGAFAYNLSYVSARMKVYLNPELDLQGKGHQPHQAKIAAGSGKLLGKGPGNSWQKLSFLPEAQNDYIAAIYAEEFGFLGMSILILFYMLIAFLGFHAAGYSSDMLGFYLAAVITFLISVQAFLNLGVVSGLLPSTGLNLPFFSQGGSSLAANMMGIGLILSVLKEAKNG